MIFMSLFNVHVICPVKTRKITHNIEQISVFEKYRSYFLVVLEGTCDDIYVTVQCSRHLSSLWDFL